MKGPLHNVGILLGAGALGFGTLHAAEEASPGGARQAVSRAETLAKALGSADPQDARDAVYEASRLVPTMEAMVALLKTAADKIALIRADFEKKASAGAGATATSFYEAELKTMKGREGDLSDLRAKLEGSVSQLKAKVEKAKANPEVQALLKDDELLRRTKEALEKLKSIKVPSVDP